MDDAGIRVVVAVVAVGIHRLLDSGHLHRRSDASATVCTVVVVVSSAVEHSAQSQSVARTALDGALSVVVDMDSLALFPARRLRK